MAAIGDPAEVLKISNSTIHEARKNSIAYNYGIDPNARVNRKARRKLSGDTQRKRGARLGIVARVGRYLRRLKNTMVLPTIAPRPAPRNIMASTAKPITSTTRRCRR